MESTPPRANAIFTAEYVPDLGESGTARLFQMELDGNEVNDELLTHYQTLAENGVFRKCMHAYIEWIRSSYLEKDCAGFIKRLGKHFKSYRNTFRQEVLDTHGRVKANFAWLEIGFRMFIDFMVDNDCLSKDDSEVFKKEFSDMLITVVLENAKSVERDDPAVIFIRNLLSLIDSGRAFVVDRFRRMSINPSQYVCYEDERCYYVNAEIAYSEIKRFCSAQGIAFTLPQTALNKLLAGKGFIETALKKTTKTVYCNGKNRRMLCIVKSKAEEVAEMYG